MLTMGSSLSPVLANIYMEFFETDLMKDIPMPHGLTIVIGYGILMRIIEGR